MTNKKVLGEENGVQGKRRKMVPGEGGEENQEETKFY